MNHFEDENEESFKPVKGLKINKSPSLPVTRKQSADSFSNQVDQVERSKRDSQENLNTLSIELLTLMQDKTLPENKNSLVKENERQTLVNLIKFCEKLDNDEFEPVNAGTTSLVTLMLSLLIRQRDRLNELEFSIEQVKLTPKAK